MSTSGRRQHAPESESTVRRLAYPYRTDFDREKAIATIESGRCPCPDCRGQLTDPILSARTWGFCKVYRCAWKAAEIIGTVYAISINGPAHTPARQPLRQLTDSDYNGHDDLR